MERQALRVSVLQTRDEVDLKFHRLRAVLDTTYSCLANHGRDAPPADTLSDSLELACALAQEIVAMLARHHETVLMPALAPGVPCEGCNLVMLARHSALRGPSGER